MATYAWLRDTHFNFVSEERFLSLIDEIRCSDATAVFLTGDIAESTDFQYWLERLRDALGYPIYFVLGNHDYYHSSIELVEQELESWVSEQPLLHWLDRQAPIFLSSNVALVGVGGWGDAGYGDFIHTPIRINDHRLIAELSDLSRDVLREKLQALGLRSAQLLRQKLESLSSVESIWVLTHVPPYPQACWHKGQAGAKDWISDFACRAVGEVLDDFALRHPNRSIQVLCGHGHSRGVFQAHPNLIVHTAFAQYRNPMIENFWSI